MPKYAVLFSFKGEAVGALIRNPSDRPAAVREALESVGGELDALYWMLGQYDGLLLASAPDAQAIAAVMMAAAGSGAFAHLETHELIEAADIADLVARASDVPFRPPGG
jgi:uncharacterized protein with GYD domain